MTKDNEEIYNGMTDAGMSALFDALADLVSTLPKATQESIADYMEFRRRLFAESDRGCALVAAAYLDDEITKLLRARMVDNKHNTDALLAQGRPIGAFSAKIRVAYAMGLIPDDVLHDINIIRDIRNKFAHLHGPLSFDDPAIKDQCGALRIALRSHRKLPPKWRFVHVVTSVYTALSIESRKPRAQVASADPLYQLLGDTERTLDLARSLPIGSRSNDENNVDAGAVENHGDRSAADK
ncbi:MltR family transcriptional regulator [Burkholderia dolosa]|uniref:MltR family transcriptional regulator n=1 Tax=Burkholderia dolosa TaxID=152500 RepID=UPI00264D218B|nr:MltR family transcriptional regulator [Burkholderia dolosa]MDN7419533.1 MltR family transcriptional regulator [Burkholderia dolosa]